MTALAEFTIPTDEFALTETLESRPELVCEVDRVVAHDTSQIMPFIWVSGGDLEGLTQILKDDPSVHDIELLSKADDERLYRLTWDEEARVIGHMVFEYGATVQRAIAAENYWTLRVLFPNREDIRKVHEFASDNDLSIELEALYGVEESERIRFNLSKKQEKALIEGFERGFYKVPREVDAQDLADVLDISHQALSERLRRATESLIKNSLIVGESDESNNNR